jgi:hypothetical protein
MTRNVIRAYRGRELGAVTRIAVSRCRLERLILMTRDAGNTRVHALQRECRLIVVESAPPDSRGYLMTELAVCREPRGAVVRRFRELKLCPMAANTICWGTSILMVRRIRMTRLTVGACVDSQQGETRLLMLLNHIGNLPDLRCMASSAVCTKLRLVDICMTGRTRLVIPRKLQSLMT